MSIWAKRTAPEGSRRCVRCGRPFVPGNEGQNYGPKCARMLAGQIQPDSQTLVSQKVLRRKKAHGETVAPATGEPFEAGEMT